VSPCPHGSPGSRLCAHCATETGPLTDEELDAAYAHATSDSPDYPAQTAWEIARMVDEIRMWRRAASRRSE